VALERLSSNNQLIGDAERNRSIALLTHACSDGRLTLDEFSERVNRVLASRTRGDLLAVTQDVGVSYAQANRPPARWTVAILGSFNRNGYWQLGEGTSTIALLGSCTLDLRRATILTSEVVINAWSVLGSVKIIVPKGTQVELNGPTILGSQNCKLGQDDVLPGAPIVRVQGLALLGSVDVVVG